MIVLAWVSTVSGWLWAQTVDEEFFENKVRPVLVENCYGCHNSLEEAEGGLALDWKGGIRASSSSGTAVVPFKPEQSLLLSVVNHEIEGLEMPEGGAKLRPEEIANLKTWIAQGAPDPRTGKPTGEQHAEETSWAETFERRKRWWSLQPVRRPALPPAVGWSDHPVDRFIHRKLRENELVPAPAADRRALLRRLSYVLTGLPPSWEETEQFENSEDPRAYEKMVDRYLASPRFGEHWARHWMDLVRYADSHGSEGDPAIPHIYQYRDYLIRAFNRDVPYDQLVREHIAGDLLSEPRINTELGINESAIGPAHLRLVFHGFAPTDALDEKVRFTDDQINVLGKAFQGMTISCARCHDHKFDAISQADYYALFGVLGSCRPAMNDAREASLQQKNKAELTRIKRKLKQVLAEQWRGELDQVSGRLQSLGTDAPEKGEPAYQRQWRELWQSARAGDPAGEGFAQTWEKISQAWQRRREKEREALSQGNLHRWDLARAEDFENWFPQGNGLGSAPARAGDFSVEADGNRVISAIYPSGVFSHSLSNLHRAVLGSPAIRVDRPLRVWLKLVGGGQSTVRYVVQNYPRSGTVYPIQNIRQPDWYWHNYDMKYWQGDDVHFELATSRDAPLQVGNQERSWFGIREVVVRASDQGAPPSPDTESLQFLWRELEADPPQTLKEFEQRYVAAIERAIALWNRGEADDAASLFLNAALQLGLLSNSVDQVPVAQPWLAKYRQLESEIPAPFRVPGVSEAEPRDQPLLNRGDHKQPLDAVPRGYLAAVDSEPFESNTSGRLELANVLVSPKNPLTSRVISNRLWHWLFGQGLVATPDNFGKLGELPSHPELLDYLADRLVEQDWSMKQAIRLIVTSQAWQQGAAASSRARQFDPANRLLSHANVRRLPAESIRDSLLWAAGELQETPYGPAFAANSFTPRRSVYIRNNRNSLDAFLGVFDAPVPFATTGRRNQTNVPAQSLTLMNDPNVIRLAQLAGQRARAQPGLQDDGQRQAHLFRQIMGRPATSLERTSMSDYFTGTIDHIQQQRETRHRATLEREKVQQEIVAILDPARQKLMDQLSTEPGQENTGTKLAPLARWDFSESLEEQVEGLATQVVGEVSRGDNGLSLDGRGFVKTDPLPWKLKEKTLEVWLQIDDLDQQGGGVFSVQDLEGGVFDALVLGEQQARHWLAGSDNFRRTERLGGEPEKVEDRQAVIHLALVYDAGGLIKVFRNGQLYGKPYHKGPPVTFAAGQSQVVFGLRHGQQVTGSRMFRGNLLEARLYGRALTAEELQASAEDQVFVSREAILQSLEPGLRSSLLEKETRVAQLTEQLNEVPKNTGESEVWTRLAHALFNLKEFIFIE
ncbi:MAG: DUF1553 domain-containing protein [Mariniblastus sp.]|nr:DUF1553 domain-containing protein [Mariniblastus sp.]